MDKFIVGYWKTEDGTLKYHRYVFEQKARAVGRAIKYSETPGIRMAFLADANKKLLAEYIKGAEVERVPNQYGGFVRQPVS